MQTNPLSLQDYVDKKKNIQKYFIGYIDDEENDDKNLDDFIAIFNQSSIKEDKNELYLFLQLILAVSNNHYRLPNFFTKLFKIILYIKEDIIKYFTNEEIFKIFKSNKRVISFLIEEKIITINESILSSIVRINNELNKYYDF